MQLWRQFEERIINDCAQCGIFITQIPLGCRIVDLNGRRKLQTIRTDFDFVAGVSGRAVFFDAKSINGDQINIQSTIMSPRKVHQYYRLLEAREMGSHAGYIIWFRDESTRQISWVDVLVVKRLFEQGFKTITPNNTGVISDPDVQTIDLSRYFKQ